MRTWNVLAGGLAAALAVGFAADGFAGDDHRRAHFRRAAGPTHLGPWVREAWAGWGYAGDWAHYDPRLVSAYPPTDEWYPWGYVAPFVRVDGKCVANEFNVSLGGEYARYQRVRPTHYCSP